MLFWFSVRRFNSKLHPRRSLILLKFPKVYWLKFTKVYWREVKLWSSCSCYTYEQQTWGQMYERYVCTKPANTISHLKNVSPHTDLRPATHSLIEISAGEIWCSVCSGLYNVRGSFVNFIICEWWIWSLFISCYWSFHLILNCEALCKVSINKSLIFLLRTNDHDDWDISWWCLHWWGSLLFSLTKVQQTVQVLFCWTVEVKWGCNFITAIIS